MEHLNKAQKVKIVFDTIESLKNFKGKNGAVDLFNESYSFVKSLKEVFNLYINGDREYKGSLYFEEIDKYIDYRFPEMNNKDPLFVIRMK
jgi:hypothetical protein